MAVQVILGEDFLDALRDAIVPRRDFAESYSKPFKACAKAKALGVMCAYNQAFRL